MKKRRISIWLSSPSSNCQIFMRKLLLTLFTLYVCAASVAQDSVTAIQDDIFGLRIGKPVSEQENISYLGIDWDHVFLYVDKDDNTLKSVELNLIVPHNFDFAPTKEDSINIVTAKVGEALDNQYGEPTRKLEGTVWHGPNDVDIVLSNDRSARTYIPDPRREGLITEAMIIQVLYLKKNE